MAMSDAGRMPAGGNPSRVTAPVLGENTGMILLGLILLILGLVLGIGILYTIGIVLIIIGAVLWVLGSMDRAVGGRRHYW
jgi:Family of unknown function (DUF6131)